MMWFSKFVVVGFCSFLSVTAVQAQSSYIAGTLPSIRPPEAPVITGFEKSEQWYAKALKGISEPYPPHLGLEDQGAWYTPFKRPGMTGPYDIRGWHEQPKTQ